MSTKTPVQIQRFVDQAQPRMDLPQQYYGDEPNAHGKDWDSSTVRMLIAASWPYEAAAGNQSIPTVYKAINIGRNEAGEQPFLCDRFYLPSTPRDMQMIEKADVPIFGIESKHAMQDFDVVGTSISYPVLIISYVRMLKISGVPVRWKDRHKAPEDHPFVIVGGQAYGAPEPLAPIVDAFWCGEVEDEPNNPGISAVFSRIEAFKASGLWSTDRMECYRELALEFNFLYFPCFLDVDYHYEDRSHVGLKEPSKQVCGYRSTLPGMRLPILKRIVKDMDAVEPLDDPPLLFADPGLGAGDLEVGRGCPAWCSFCALTFRQKPYRQRSVPFMVEYAKRSMRNMGSIDLTPFMPDFPMHTQRKDLISNLLENVSDEVDSSAMRVDDFIAEPDWILLQVHGGMDRVTLGVEGNSQRMRDLVGKGCADEDIREAVTRGIRAGIRKFKMFMISNLPGEDEGDVFRILKLGKDLADIRDTMNQPNIRIQFSWTPLLIEANTPFQWFAPTPASRALADAWEEFRQLKIEFKLGSKGEVNKATYFQLCQRASREIGEVLVDVSEGLGKACWGGVPKHTRAEIEAGMRARGFLNGTEDAFDERFKHDMFGWEFIDQGVSSELLWVTYMQMKEFIESTDSYTYDEQFGEDYHGNEWVERCDTKCYGSTCGVCDVDDLAIRRGYIVAAQHDSDIDLSRVKIIDQRSTTMRVRARIRKTPDKRFIMNSHWRFHVRRAAFKNDVPITKRSLRFASDDIKYKDWTCGVDYMEFGLTRRCTPAEVQGFIDAMNAEMVGLQIEQWTQHPPSGDALRTDVDLSLWEMELDEDPSVVLGKLAAWERADYIKMVLKQEAAYFAQEREEFNAKDFVDDMWLVRDGHTMKLRMLLRGRPSPYNIYAALMGRNSWLDAAKYAAVRVESFVEQDENQQDFFRPVCVDTGKSIPVNPLDEPYDLDRTPRAKDAHEGRLVSAVTFV